MPKVAPRGLLVCNDYTNWSVSQLQRYGSVAAINNFANEYRWPIKCFALETSGC